MLKYYLSAVKIAAYIKFCNLKLSFHTNLKKYNDTNFLPLFSL